MKQILGFVAALMLTTTATFAHGVSAGKLEIIHPNIPQPTASAKSAAGYMAIANDGTEADRLIGVETPIAKSAMLHTTEHSADGVARMMHVEALEIPAGDTIVLEPGGMHVMLMGLTGAMVEGDMIPATLIFEHAGRVEMEFMVDPPGGVDHSKMDHGAMGGAADGDAPAQIEAVLMAQFDRPEAPLVLSVITVQDDVAVVGWLQGDRGGRAFMRRDEAGWVIELCSGESLLLPASFVSMGLTAAAAQTLSDAVKTAEADLDAAKVAQMNSFEGTQLIGRAAMVGN